MRRNIITFAALLLTAGLVYVGFMYAKNSAGTPSANLPLVRVWAAEQEPSVWAWLRRQAKQYEKETGIRVYLRAVSGDMIRESGDAFPPDALITGNGSRAVAMLGYALFFRDDAQRTPDIHPTSLLFFQSSPTPGPSSTPAPTPDAARFSVVLTPLGLESAVPGGAASPHAAQDFAAGKGDAALLTADEAMRLPFPVSASPLAKGEGSLPIFGSAGTDGGEAFLNFLCTEPAQKSLRDHGLYSPFLLLYRGADPLREMIENSL